MAEPRQNLAWWPPDGLVIAVQYWAGDEPQAIRLARLLADIEPERRDDVTIALCRRFDCPKSPEAQAAYWHCAEKFKVMFVQSQRMGEGHPDGCNALWGGTFAALARSWARGRLRCESAFFVEPDGVPLHRDWIDRLRAEHASALRAGRRITGCLTENPIPHVNGTLLAHLSLWYDAPSIRIPPPVGQAWDLFHRAPLLQHTQPTSLVRNIYGATGWTPTALKAMSREIAWLASAKDDTAFEYARTLVAA
jgi:hypothetical protein